MNIGHFLTALYQHITGKATPKTQTPSPVALPAEQVSHLIGNASKPMAMTIDPKYLGFPADNTGGQPRPPRPQGAFPSTFADSIDNLNSTLGSSSPNIYRYSNIVNNQNLGSMYSNLFKR